MGEPAKKESWQPEESQKGAHSQLPLQQIPSEAAPFVKNKRKVFLINPEFQLHFMLYMALITLCGAVVILAGQNWFVEDLMQVGHDLGLPVGHPYFRFVTQQKDKFMNLSLLTCGLLTIIQIPLGLWLSHRVAGPLHRLTRTMKEWKSGDPKGPIHHRKNDFFPEVYQAYGTMMEELDKEKS